MFSLRDGIKNGIKNGGTIQKGSHELGGDASNSTEKIPKHNGSSSGIRGIGSIIVVLEIVVAVVVVVVEVDLDHLQS